MNHVAQYALFAFDRMMTMMIMVLYLIFMVFAVGYDLFVGRYQVVKSHIYHPQKGAQ